MGVNSLVSPDCDKLWLAHPEHFFNNHNGLGKGLELFGGQPISQSGTKVVKLQRPDFVFQTPRSVMTGAAHKLCIPKRVGKEICS